MSVITGYGEKLGRTPSIDGDQDVEVHQVPSMEDQVVVHGQKVPVIRLPPTPLFLKESKIHDSSLRGRGVVAVPGDAAPQPPVARTPYMVMAPIHDRAPRPSFVVNLGDVNYRPVQQLPWLGPTPIAVGGGRKRYHVSAGPEAYYSLPASVIHGVRHEEPEPETYVVFSSPPINAPIHDYSRLIAL